MQHWFFVLDISQLAVIRLKTWKENLAFYILYELEANRMTGVIPLPHSPSQHIEHIMPKRPSNAQSRQHEWSHVEIFL
ncbi:GmrSD restriction endonuclease domain-containing protein [Defluviitalea raffinosedens]|uniref:GmrSD restriction endonuclease domain-containing protein n=1 Tax=Defluviitalea raffinosedens TaxID=1450156 RepID=UPI003A7F3354